MCVLSRCSTMGCSPPLSVGSSVHGLLQARILEWVVISSSRGSSRPRDRTCISGVSCSGRWVLELPGRSPLLWISFPSRPPQSTEQSPLCCMQVLISSTHSINSIHASVSLSQLIPLGIYTEKKNLATPLQLPVIPKFLSLA